jgi:hypothetical protein
MKSRLLPPVILCITLLWNVHVAQIPTDGCRYTRDPRPTLLKSAPPPPRFVIKVTKVHQISQAGAYS